jgi:hypothetical protein
VIDADALSSTLQQTKDNNIEIDLLLEVLNQINTFVPDSDFSQMVEKVNQERGKLPRFMAFQKEKEVAFPEFIPVHKPKIHDYKRASNKIAELALDLDIKPDDYELEPAKEILNRLRRSVVEEIQTEVLKYDGVFSIPYLIERLDALEDDHDRQKFYLHQSLKHEVDFERDKSYSNEHREFIRHHKHFRYLIEKFVQLRPRGTEKLTQERFQYLVALVDQLHHIYFASDSLHYNIYPVGITLSDEYLISVNYDESLEEKQEALGREQARISLGEIGVETDRVETPGSLDEYLNDLDEAFVKDLGFRLKNLVAVLTVLSRWPGYEENSKLATHYTAQEKILLTVFQKSIIDVSKEEAARIINFLTLKSNDVIRISGQAQPADDIPVWEHRKRYSRYNIRSLIFLDGQYYWGAHSAKRSEILWSHVPLDHALPAALSTATIDKVLESKHRLVENEIENKVLEIIRRYTPYADGNVYLHQRAKESKHPIDLGDYDVLAFLPEKNIILNIECKEISPAFCAKDAKRMREKFLAEKREKRAI